MAKKEKIYLKNKDLYIEIVISKAQDELTPRAQQMLLLLANRAINNLRYANPKDREDCLSFAILDLLKYWRGFNPKYKNAFAYFTEISKRGFAKGWNKIYPKKYHGTMSIDGFGRNAGGDTDSGIYSI